MPGTAAGTCRFRQRTVASATCSGVACVGALLAGDHHVGLEDHAFEVDALPLAAARTPPQSTASVTSSQRSSVCAPSISTSGSTIGTMFLLLAQRRVARQRVGIGLDGVARGNAGADVDDRAPFGEARAELVVLDQPLAQPIEPLGDGLAGKCASGLAPLSTLMPGR